MLKAALLETKSSPSATKHPFVTLSVPVCKGSEKLGADHGCLLLRTYTLEALENEKYLFLKISYLYMKYYIKIMCHLSNPKLNMKLCFGLGIQVMLLTLQYSYMTIPSRPLLFFYCLCELALLNFSAKTTYKAMFNVENLHGFPNYGNLIPQKSII